MWRWWSGPDSKGAGGSSWIWGIVFFKDAHLIGVFLSVAGDQFIETPFLLYDAQDRRYALVHCC